jgi:hypothetical protein
MFLQVKEANASVLEAYAGKSAYPHHGQLGKGDDFDDAMGKVALAYRTTPR